MVKFNAEKHQPVEDDGWVYHYGVVVFSVTDFTGECFHAWCLSSDAPPFIVIDPAGDPIQITPQDTSYLTRS